MIIKKLLYLLAAVALLTACSSIDCPMNSHVYARYGFYVAGDTAVSMNGYLSVSASKMDGNDTILLNKLSNAHDFQLPMSYLNPTDTLNFTIGFEDGYELTDQLYVQKTNVPHFESVECGAKYFHTITSVSSTNNFIDSVKIIRNDVNYDATQEHIYIYLKR